MAACEVIVPRDALSISVSMGYVSVLPHRTACGWTCPALGTVDVESTITAKQVWLQGTQTQQTGPKSNKDLVT